MSKIYNILCPNCGQDKVVSQATYYKHHRGVCVMCKQCAVTSRSNNTLSSSPFYKRWLYMKGRCYTTSHVSYEYYGGRGIGVCEEWRDNPRAFIQWCEEQGEFPSNYQLDRIDTNKDYAPDNCRFVSPQVNNLNKRNIKITRDLYNNVVDNYDQSNISLAKLYKVNVSTIAIVKRMINKKVNYFV